MGDLESCYYFGTLSPNVGIVEPWCCHHVLVLQIRAMPGNIPYEKQCYERSTRLVHQFQNSVKHFEIEVSHKRWRIHG
jgi:hypothetical protein